ncbi:N-acetyltransferase [Alkalihalophilus pseudofirmus]|uniref:GNAT family N-acetyltransferase n=1 Tax=Alkalihalophilus pseudofirmus TaxID=79885 RepID=UPI0009515CFC|nr:N-acetyltransferase [Alkalihalophilus pseudofirmus]
MIIDKMNPDDWTEVKGIYCEGIADGNATFQTEAPSWEEWDRSHDNECRLVARIEGELAGWAALSPVSNRRVYAGVAEVSVYVSHKWSGKGLGSLLLSALVDLSENRDIWTLQSSIFPENTASLFIHKKCGFREVGKRERIGKMNGVWRDTILLERRSQLVGID